MLTTRIIPCLDVRDGRVVKGVKFQGLRDAGSPSELAAEYELQGADEIAILDVSATIEGRGAQLATVRAVRAQVALPLTIGGGVHDISRAESLLEAGADKVSINTAAVERADLIDEMSSRFGCQCTVLAIDAARNAKGFFEVVTRSGSVRTGIDAVAWAREAAQRGAGEILLTSWDRDGTRAGYDLELIRAIVGAVKLPIIASGGAANADHMVMAVRAGASALLAASIFHFGEYSVATLKQELATKGMEMRI